MMKKSFFLILIPALWGIWACATSPSVNSSADGPGQGDRELNRGIYWYQKGCSLKAMEHFHAAPCVYLKEVRVIVRRNVRQIV